MRTLSTVAVICLLLLGAAANGMTTAKDSQAEDLGKALGRAFVREARALSKAGMRARDCQVKCESEADRKALVEVCAAEEAITDVGERIDDASQRGLLPERSVYEDTHSFYMFRVLQDALATNDPLVRWNTLERIRWLCDYKTLLADAADKPCEREAEDACLKILNTDHDPENRRLALEILSSGYATVQSASVLETILHSTDDSTEKELSAKALRLLESSKK
jgi:hypothetical protein